jgi:hypothetical protein
MGEGGDMDEYAPPKREIERERERGCFIKECNIHQGG